MPTATPPSPHDKLDRTRAYAQAMGVTDEYITLLVNEFYARVRKDERLGPIFQATIQDLWDVHLPKMIRFWGAIVFSDGRFSGNPMQAHKRLTAVTPADFEIWLRLFGETLEATAPTTKAKDYFLDAASRIAESLKRGMFFDGAGRPP